MFNGHVRQVALRGAPLFAFVLASPAALAQTKADYERALGLRDKYQNLTVGAADAATWIGKSSRFNYRRSVAGGHEFVIVHAATQQKRPAFDHERLAKALSKETGGPATGPGMSMVPASPWTITS